MKIINTEREKKFTVSGASAEQVEQIVNDLPFYVRVLQDGDNVDVKCSNKREGAKVRELLETPVVAAEQESEKQSDGATRRPELVEVAERDGLNRGKGWIASDYDVDRLGIHPSWAGQAICYVYE